MSKHRCGQKEPLETQKVGKKQPEPLGLEGLVFFGSGLAMGLFSFVHQQTDWKKLGLVGMVGSSIVFGLVIVWFFIRPSKPNSGNDADSNHDHSSEAQK